MAHSITPNKVRYVVHTLHVMAQKELINLPHGKSTARQMAFFPEYISGNNNPPLPIHPFTREDWEELAWNPPLFIDRNNDNREKRPHLFEPDPTASPKPTWAEIEEGFELYAFSDYLNYRRDKVMRHLKKMARDLIREKYIYYEEEITSNNTNLWDLEVEVRLRKGTNPEWTRFIDSCDVWREHYKKRYREFRHYIYVIATYDEIYPEFIVPIILNRKNWDATTWRHPNGRGELYSGGSPNENVPPSYPAPSDTPYEPKEKLRGTSDFV